ncbi:DUF4249 domain-containing protein [Dyadobacter sp.]|uniref:DUF4249 domain-containing protein n=1 Tax=Dyadobacter sp. TaxID=1914288 RepID=UPI003F7240CE
MKISIVIAFILWISLSACESLVTQIDDADLPKTESRLTVQAFISPENPRIIIAVTQSRPLFGDPNTTEGIIRNAVVTLSDASREVTVPFDSTNDLYVTDKARFPVVAGRTYKITVTQGGRTVTSTCSVPAKAVVPMSFELDTAYTSFSDTTLRLKVKWNDIPGERNYYRVRAFVDLEYSIPEGVGGGKYNERRVRNRFNVNWEETIGRDNFQSDANLDGTVFTSPTGTLRLPGPTGFATSDGSYFTVYPKSKIISMTMEVLNTDENYFRYHKSLDNARNADNPFVEPSLVFTNIEGGLGCFAAYHTGQLIYRPK